ncbi:TPA: response regulator transcription factor [Klebsiella pneumoniae]|uniref:helix-turn-helix transcriptional regulator n=2 Tax=Klebsiella/Raoultella group TaxID=2890311 RepID=UPI000E2C1F36|nr:MULTISPECIES: LuxR C-terminal-related transcriptional regulator [Klebsiella/Raoultella group]HCB1873300.1 LuxR family transcriptional regulator [Citrobacter freundii]EKW3531099.1 LuxR family transcriptional regulator [Raoultella planticola]ELF4970397.1 LuxR family transcriptional regulator [Raoultella planticola]ELU1427007.1 LuxR family transcriptional regulator [Raoultella planticola]MBF7822961.1 LuxR family transcriptional regulator [Klebsiella quasivariicola]
MNSILIYTDDNIIGKSIHEYMIDNVKDITTLNLQDIVKGISALPTATVIINIIHKDISAGTMIALLNTLRIRLSRCTMLVLVVKSDLAPLCRELLYLDNLLILTDRSSLSDFSAIINRPLTADGCQGLCTRRTLTARELQVLELIIDCNNNKRIALLLNIDHKTVHSHKVHIMKKLGMNNSRIMNKMIVNMYRC